MNSRRGGESPESGDRGVSEVLGAILVFGLVLAVLALVQLSAVPAANQQIEFEHSQRIDGDLQGLDDSIDRAATTGLGESVTIEAGVRYPPRLFLLNPPAAAGTIRSSEGQIAMDNVEALNSETDQFFSEVPLEYDTISVNQRTEYNEYQNSPERYYENGILYSRFSGDGEDRNIYIDTGNVVNGRQISLIALGGSFSTTTADRISLATQPISVTQEKVTIRNRDANQPIRITLHSALSPEEWRTNIVNGEPNVRNVVAGPTSGTVDLVLEPGSYDLRMANVRLGDNPQQASPYYMTIPSETSSIVQQGSTTQLEVQVRDKFNNPVSGVDVRFTLTDPEIGKINGADDPVIAQTDENGKARVAFSAASDAATGSSSAVSVPVLAEARLQDSPWGDLGDGTPENPDTDTDSYEFVAFDDLVTITPGDSGQETEDDEGDLKDINPREIVLKETSLGTGGDTNKMTVTFQNQGDQKWSLSLARMAFVLTEDETAYVDITDVTDGNNRDLGRFTPAEGFTYFGPLTMDSSEEVELRFEFYKADGTDATIEGGSAFDSYFVFSTYQSVPDSDPTVEAYRTYFISDGINTAPSSLYSQLDATGTVSTGANKAWTEVRFDFARKAGTPTGTFTVEWAGGSESMDYSYGANTYTGTETIPLPDVPAGQDLELTAIANGGSEFPSETCRATISSSNANSQQATLEESAWTCTISP